LSSVAHSGVQPMIAYRVDASAAVPYDSIGGVNG
jgi:hypothetical protein